jgi:histidinol-phosphate aminotransferase
MPVTRVSPQDQAEARAQKWVRPSVRALTAYHVPPAEGRIKLDAMENPYQWPAEMEQEWLQCLHGAPLNRYPDPTANAVRERLRASLSLAPDQLVMLGNGSDELIQIIQLSLAGPGRVVMAPVPTFVMYQMIARFVGAEFVGVPLRDDFTLDRDRMLAAIHRHDPSVIFIAYPNNPSGNLFERPLLQEIIEAADGLVVIDEAYHVFAGESFIADIGHYANVVVMRTLSKMGLAGLRLGYLAGAAAWLQQFDKVRLPYNINVLTQISAVFALERSALFEEQAARIVAERERVASALTERGFTVFPSATNFLLFRGAGSAARTYEHLLDHKVLIKNLHQADTPLADCLRVTVGTPEENDAFLAGLRQF